MNKSLRKSRKRPLIVVRRMLTEPKTDLAGVVFEVFARFKASVVAFNAEMAPSRFFGRWDPASMRDSSMGIARKASNPNRAGRQSRHDAAHVNRSRDEIVSIRSCG